MITRLERTVPVVGVFAMLFLFAIVIWNGSSAFFAAATDRTSGQYLHAVGPSSCNDDSTSFVICEAPVAQSLLPAILTLPGLPATAPSAILTEVSNTIDLGMKSYDCSRLIDARKADDAGNNVTSQAASCCDIAEYPITGVTGASPGTSGCSCNPRECKCT
ncbi:MAG: hypothetical protein HY287_03725 [Planctomycetes bacterium]|nr:hypothetical protein [Planctomycetota bacterium]MBI3833421.1 hypothetical protein [Planctomycetota bacterium]